MAGGLTLGLSWSVPGIGFHLWFLPPCPRSRGCTDFDAHKHLPISTCLIPQRLLGKNREQEGTLSGGGVGIIMEEEEEVDGHFIILSISWTAA